MTLSDEGVVMRLISCALFLSAVSIGPLAAAQTPKPEHVSVCQVDADLQRYEGRLVELEGHLVSDFNHASGVADDACPQQWIMLGRTRPDAEGDDQFEEAWLVTRSCPEDGLMFTVRGYIERQYVWQFDRWVISAVAFTNLRRAEGSQCPMTMRELEALQEGQSARARP